MENKGESMNKQFTKKDTDGKEALEKRCSISLEKRKLKL